MACPPDTARRCAAIYADGLQRLRARGVDVPAGPMMSTRAGTQSERRATNGWDMPKDAAGREELVRLATAAAAGVAGPDDRRRRASTAARAPTAARAALPRAARPRTSDDVNAAARATWAAYRAGGAA